jgi:hypothetical protein
MIVAIFILIKIGVARILLNPGKSGFGGGAIKIGDRGLKNFKLIATVVGYAVLDYLDDITNDPRLNLGPGSLPELEEHLFQRRDIGPIYMSPYIVNTTGMQPRQGDFHREILDAIHIFVIKFVRLIDEQGKLNPEGSKAGGR